MYLAWLGFGLQDSEEGPNLWPCWVITSVVIKKIGSHKEEKECTMQIWFTSCLHILLCVEYFSYIWSNSMEDKQTSDGVDFRVDRRTCREIWNNND